MATRLGLSYSFALVIILLSLYGSEGYIPQLFKGQKHNSRLKSNEKSQGFISPTEKASRASNIAKIRDCANSCVAAMILGMVFMIPPTTSPVTASRYAAFADDPAIVMAADNASTSPSKEEATSDKSSESEKSIFEATLSEEDRLKERSLVQEVWGLEDKYYLDRTFNSQDWNEVKKNFLKQEEKNGSEENAMNLITKMTKSLGDKYSRVLDKNAYTAIQKYDLIGVGVTLMPNSDKSIIVGAPPVAGSAADKAGLKLGDFVSAVNGIPTSGRTAFDIIDQISENPNAETVTMTIRTQGPNDLSGEGFIRDVTMPRAFAEVRNPVIYKITETRNDGKKVGYIRISEFNSLVKTKVEEALVALKRDGANAFVLDLRMNPGGAFQSAVEISSLFYEDQVATYVLDRNQVELPFRTPKGHVIMDSQDPMVIWLDGRSASASEVLAGSLHDNCKAIVMGDVSFGKGLVQAVYGLQNGSGLVLTVAKYLTPSGNDIQGTGIVPDIKGGVPLSFINLSSDTSKVDFQEVSGMLNMCKVPSPH